MTVEFRVLGTLEVAVRGRLIAVPAGQSRVVLIGLLLRANEIVTVEQLVAWLWDGSPPNSDRAAKTLHMIVARLRKALGEANVVTTAPGGYVAVVRPEQLDLARFRALVASGGYAEALSLWRGPGPVLTDVRSNSLQQDEIAPLVEERLAALELRIEDDLGGGRHLDVLPELRALTRQNPLRETFWTQLVLALDRADRQAEALAAYREVTRLLAEELGSTPSRRLRDLHQHILAGPSEPPPRPVPRQLPASCPHFVGRGDEVAALNALADADSMTIAVISGTAGVGKTTLAVQWAHEVADRFPDGQLFVNLRGFGPDDDPMSADGALRSFLDAFEVPPDQISSTEDGRAAQFRSLLSGRKVLILLDNARDAEQIRALLPASPGCLVVVTSRNQLPGLVAKESARPLDLATMPHAEAVAMLARHVGADRVRAEPGAAAALVSRCAGLPLAVLVVAARAARAARGTGSLRAVADDLTRLPPDLRAVFSWSYQQLEPDTARLFRWLSLHPGRDIGVHAAAALMNVPLVRIRRAFRQLRRAHLVTGQVPERFGCHDLLRLYAGELCEQYDSAQDRRDALHRVLDYYLHCADRSDDLLPLTRTDVGIAPRHRPQETPSLASPDDASAWFDSELANVVAAIGLAAANEFPTHAWQLAFTLSRHLWLRVDFPTLLHVCLTALPGAALEPEAHLTMLLYIGGAHRRLGDHDEALAWYRRAVEVSAEISPVAHARVLLAQGVTLDQMRRYQEAEQCFLDGLAAVLGSGVHWLEALLRHNLGCLYNTLDRLDEAEREIRSALDVHVQEGESLGALQGHDELARIRLKRGQLDEAPVSGHEALLLAQENDNAHFEAVVLDQIGDTLARMGSPDAVAHWEKALRIFEELGEAHADGVREKLQAERNV
jgi:DNA-binding SARP family transcriptional activator/tetratricopeptide (TPR) repeat protein